MVERVKIDGLRELQEALHELPKATAKNVMKRVLMARAKPIAEAMRANAPVKFGDLKKSITASTKLSKRQRSQHKKEGKDDVEVYIGPGPDPAAHLEEFGSVHNKLHPFVRPAWDQLKGSTFLGLRDDLWSEIKKAAERLARKSQRAARG